MIKLTELLHQSRSENNSGLINIDKWRFTEVDHLISMGFDVQDDYHISTNKPPYMIVYKKYDSPENKSESCFYVEEKNSPLKKFKSFSDVIEYFDKYEQPSIDQYN